MHVKIAIFHNLYTVLAYQDAKNIEGVVGFYLLHWPVTNQHCLARLVQWADGTYGCEIPTRIELPGHVEMVRMVFGEVWPTIVAAHLNAQQEE